MFLKILKIKPYYIGNFLRYYNDYLTLADQKKKNKYS